MQPAAGGAFVAQYVATAAGEYEVVVTLRGEPLPQRPTVTVLGHAPPFAAGETQIGVDDGALAALAKAWP